MKTKILKVIIMNEKIKKWINKNESWKLEGYTIPSKIYSPRSFGIKEIETKDFRDKSINKISKHEKTLIDLLDSTQENYIREFPVPIFDHELWYNLCKTFRADEDDITGKSILWLDFFLLERDGAVLEADGAQHWDDVIQYKTDFIRDQYLKQKYGIETYRFSKFLDSWEDGLEWVLLNTPQVSRYNFKEWDDGLISQWKIFHYDELIIMKYLNTLKSINGVINLTIREIIKCSTGALKNKNDVERFNKLFYHLYGKKIQILSNPYK